MNEIHTKIRAVSHRCLIFYTVGAMGIAVQITVLFALAHCARLGYLLSTALGVEAAVLHNFAWHERWTWADRIGPHGSVLKRLLRFHIANGVVSLAGNVILMQFFVGHLGWSLLCANGLSIAICSVLNFVAGDRLVFRRS